MKSVYDKRVNDMHGYPIDIGELVNIYPGANSRSEQKKIGKVEGVDWEFTYGPMLLIKETPLCPTDPKRVEKRFVQVFCNGNANRKLRIKGGRAIYDSCIFSNKCKKVVLSRGKVKRYVSTGTYVERL